MIFFSKAIFDDVAVAEFVRSVRRSALNDILVYKKLDNINKNLTHVLINTKSD